MEWGAKMADEVRQDEGFREEDGGKVEELRLVLPIGNSVEEGESSTVISAIGTEPAEPLTCSPFVRS